MDQIAERVNRSSCDAVSGFLIWASGIHYTALGTGVTFGILFGPSLLRESSGELLRFFNCDKPSAPYEERPQYPIFDPVVSRAL